MPNWNQVLNEIATQEAAYNQAARNSLVAIRHKYLSALHAKTGRNIIVYYSGWLSKPNNHLNALNDEDKNGFMTAVHNLDRSRGLDLFLHTPGGSISATQSLVNYLHMMFGTDIRAVIPQIAMSAGTMVACSCKSILMGKESNLGPIDPQLAGVPAYAVIEEFKRACNEISLPNGEIDKAKLAIWQQIISKYRPTFLTQCEHAIARSNEFVEDQLTDVMFSGLKTAKTKAKKVVRELTKYQDGHDRHYHIDDCRKMGLKIEPLEKDDELQDLVLTVHHCYMHTLMNTPAFKIIENHNGIGMLKNEARPK
ncbi:MAG: S49 family peptidase [Candidatus Sedimenticola sp. (ex Thyasira tokunagai)]